MELVVKWCLPLIGNWEPLCHNQRKNSELDLIQISDLAANPAEKTTDEVAVEVVTKRKLNEGGTNRIYVAMMCCCQRSGRLCNSKFERSVRVSVAISLE